jgi:stage IV sporulation protein FB
MIFGRRDSEDFGEKPPSRYGLGGDWHGLRPSFDNPLSWSVPLFRFAGIAVRMHIVFIIYIVIELLRSEFSPSREAPPVGFEFMALLLGCLALIVLLHEFGHCFACRWTGGVADEILMWPLGGLAYCKPEHTPRSHFITAAGGPLVNVAICVVCGVALGAITGVWWGVALPNPLFVWDPIFADPPVLTSWWMIGLYFVNALSLVLLLFNLLPMFPLDGGRLLQAVLWPKLGYATSMRFAVRIGFVGAVLLGVFGAVMGRWMLVGIAVFGGVTCYMTIKQLAYTNAMLGFESDEYLTGGFDDSKEEKVSRRDRRREKEEARRQREMEEVDRILAKIKASGMESLTGREKRLLHKATERGKES